MSERHERRDDDIGRLVRLAGKREPVPAERAARVRAAAMASWRELRDARRLRTRRRLAWSGAIAAGVALALVGGFVVDRTAHDDGAVLAAHTVEAVDGALTADGVPATVGTSIVAGVTLATDAAGRAALRLASGHSLRLDRATTVSLEPGPRLELRRGALYVDSDGSADRTALVVGTPLGTVREIGTQFAVRRDADDSVAILLREGAVVVELGAARERVAAGGTLTIDVDGSLERGRLAADAPEWTWAGSIAPPLALADRTAHDVLAAIAREHGRVLAYADDDAARHASATVLGPGLAPMTPDDALRAVLPVCRLRADALGDRLIVAIDATD